jgi:hypothetical protein
MDEWLYNDWIFEFQNSRSQDNGIGKAPMAASRLPVWDNLPHQQRMYVLMCFSLCLDARYLPSTTDTICFINYQSVLALG